jgi:hypothetical protein
MVFFAVSLFVCIIVFIAIIVVKHIDIICGFYLAICVIFAFISVQEMMKLENPKPAAIDVYRDKTTLEVTYRDSVAIDSTVVFKKYDIDGR